VQKLPHADAPQARRLLRLLLVWLGEVPAQAIVAGARQLIEERLVGGGGFEPPTNGLKEVLGTMPSESHSSQK
jgi:hypothetical protein